MAFPFFGRKQADLTPREKAEVEELCSYAEITANEGLEASIRAAFEKSISSAEYYQYLASTGDTEGNYFGSEFNIRATAARIKGLYGREPWMYATASLIARTLTTVPFIVKNKITDEPDPNHPLNKKLKAASRVQDSKSTQWNGYLDMILGGNYILAFDQAYNEALVVPVENCELKLAADYMSIDSIYAFSAETGKATQIPYKQVIHHKFPNPYNPFWGLSIFAAASRPILLDRMKNEFEYAFYLRGGTSQGVIETTEDINKTRMKRLLRTFEQTYTGKRNWWRQIFLPKGASFKSTGFTFDQLKHFEGLRENRLSLLAVLGIPPSKVGIVQDVNRSTAELQERDFWMNTIKPFAEFIAAAWNNSYLVKNVYGGLVEVEADFSDVEALQGSLITKGEHAKSMEGYFWIDEIRQKVFQELPLPNNAGQKFVAEVRPAQQPGMLGALGLSAPGAQPAPVTATPVEPLALEEPKAGLSLLSLKAQVSGNQDRIERSLSKDFLSGYEKYLEVFYHVVRGLVLAAQSKETVLVEVENALKAAEEDLLASYLGNLSGVYQRSLDRGFSFANSNAKDVSAVMTKKASQFSMAKNVKTGNVVVAVLKGNFDAVDEQAIDLLRQEQADGQRTILQMRNIDTFEGMNATRSKEVLNIIADALEQGATNLETIAETIRTVHDERYGDQSFTIARTEVLTAVSQGMKWNQDVLQTVFTDVQKQWFHVGDAGSNPNARDWHADFEKDGPQPYGYKWGGVLEYPRDPGAGPEEVVNCRCSMVTVIPESAQSNAEVILERE